MNVSIVIATHGDPAWEELAWSRAYPSTMRQGALEVLVEHDPHGTLASVRNGTAFEAAGDWLCFLDADDELTPGYLDAMRAGWVSRKPELEASPDLRLRWGLLVPAVQYVHPDGHEDSPAIPNSDPPRPLHEVNRAVIGTLVPRELFLHVGGFPEEPVYEDWALWLACARAGARLVDVPAAVYRAHARTGSRNLAPSSTAKEVYWRLRRQHEAWLESVPPGV